MPWGPSGGAPRRLSYLDSLRLGEKTLDNPRDAEQVFKQLLRKSDRPEMLAVACDEKLLPVLKDALAITAGQLDVPVQLLAALGAEKLSHGAYAGFVVAAFRAFFEAPGFLGAVRSALLDGSLQDPAAVAWMLIKLACEVKEVRQQRDPDLKEVVELLKTCTKPGMAALTPRLNTLFARVTAPAGDEVSEDDEDAAAYGSAQGTPMVSLEAAKAAPRPPGVRDHDNDPEDFRSISITPTPSELNCRERPYLPPPEGSAFIDDSEAAMLDRHFRLMREDMLGSLREELAEELAGGPAAFRRVFQGPRLAGIDRTPQPCVLLTVPLPDRLQSRVQKMKAAELRDFLHNGPGRRVLGQDTLVLLMQEPSGGSTEAGGSCGNKIHLETVAVGVVVARRGRDWDMLQHDGRLMVGVSFLGYSSMEAVSRQMGGRPQAGLQAPPSPGNSTCTSAHPVLSSYLFNATAAFFTFEPVLRALQRMDTIPLGNTLARIVPPGCPQLPHGGRSIADFSPELLQAVASDDTQVTPCDKTGTHLYGSEGAVGVHTCGDETEGEGDRQTDSFWRKL